MIYNNKWEYKYIIKVKLMQEVYEANKDEDGFLYITITNLETYG